MTFIQDATRKHLYDCLIKGVLTMFPVARRKHSTGANSSDTIPVYCHCRMPEITPMVKCSLCKEWYRTECVDVSEDALNDSDLEWFCNLWM